MDYLDLRDKKAQQYIIENYGEYPQEIKNKKEND